MRISWDNYSVYGTLTGSPAPASGYSYANLARSERSLIVVVPSSTSIQAQSIWGYDASVNTVALFGLPQGSGTIPTMTVTVETYDGSAWTTRATTLFTNGVPDNAAFMRMGHWTFRNAIWRADVALVVRGARITCSVGSAQEWRASRLFAGSAWALNGGASYEAAFDCIDTSESVRAADGTLRTIPGVAYRTMRIPFKSLVDFDIDWLYFQHNQGVLKTKDLLILPFWGEGSLREANEAMIGRVTGDISAMVRAAWLPGSQYNIRAAMLELEEV